MTAANTPDIKEMRVLARSLLRAASAMQKASEREPFLKLGDVLTWVALDYGFVPEVLRGPSRRQDFFKARAEAMRIMHDQYGFSYSKIARYFFRDHTTVLHAIRRARTWKQLAAEPVDKSA